MIQHAPYICNFDLFIFELFQKEENQLDLKLHSVWSAFYLLYVYNNKM